MTTPDKTFRNALLIAGATGTVALLVMITGWQFLEFDAALLTYAEAAVVSLALTAYRVSIWAQRPPTLMLYHRGLKMLIDPKGWRARLRRMISRSITYFGANHFVWKRGRKRWGAHWPIMLGCVMAVAIVTPLICGWIWFETLPQDLHRYQVMVLGLPLRTIPVDGIEAFVAFHGLVWASLPVVVGTSMALWRRLRDRGERATQSIETDIAPLLVLQMIALSGLLMAASYSFFHGVGHAWLAKFHCLVVVVTLIWLPYSKLIHIPQRTLKLAHMVYQHEAPQRGKALCVRCNREFGDRQQILDLIEVQRTLGYRYDLDEGTEHYQWVCPPCRRATLVIAQGHRWHSTHDAVEPAPTGLITTASTGELSQVH